MKSLSSALALGALGSAAGAAATNTTDSFVTACNDLADTISSLDNVTASFTEYVASGGNISMTGIPSVCATTPQQVSADLCRVYMNVSTSDRSGIRLETWLPREFNGRFLSTGNNGMAGCVKYADVNWGTMLGFATVGANNGHDGDTAEYFLNNTEVLEDFAWRSVHTGTVVGKEITNIFYEEGYNKSYYAGCSTGGREGYKAVQYNPDDYDGVLAGSAAMNFINLASWGAYLYWLTGNSSAASFLNSDQWTAVHELVISQCDGLDGAEDGIIEDADNCHPIIEPLICNSTSSADSTCITGTQAKTVNKVFSDWYGPDGTLYYPRMNPGGEESAAAFYLGGTPFSTSTTWYRYVVFGDADWDPTTWVPENAKTALDQNPFNIQTFDADLSAFKNSGGKLLSYHGTVDPIITSDDSKLYYRSVAANMSLSPTDLDEFYRFFGIGGMGHCGSGDGAVYIGQSEDTYLASEPENNLLLALVDWVENGNAPDYVRGAASDDGETATFFRRHCRYPRRNKYVGPGNYTDEDAWQCV